MVFYPDEKGFRGHLKYCPMEDVATIPNMERLDMNKIQIHTDSFNLDLNDVSVGNINQVLDILGLTTLKLPGLYTVSGVKDGFKIQAIKAYRIATGVDLKVAKDRVENLKAQPWTVSRDTVIKVEESMGPIMTFHNMFVWDGP